MAKGFTPIIGLAVVVALAMAAVFGAMSLTSPTSALAAQMKDPVVPGSVRVNASSEEPGDNARYTLMFTATKDPADATVFAAGADEIVVKMDDFVLPDSIRESSVSMRVADSTSGTAIEGTGTANPVAVTVGSDKVTLMVPDFDLSNEEQRGIKTGDRVTIFFQQSADITNPTEGGGYPGKLYPWVVEGVSSTDPKGNYKFGDYSDAGDDVDAGTVQASWKEVDVKADVDDEIDKPDEDTVYDALPQLYKDVVIEEENSHSVRVPIIIDIDADDNEASRGDTVTLTGKGYKNGTTLTFWLDSNADGVRNDGGTTLCTTDVGKDDTGSCSFPVANPPFAPGTGICEVSAASTEPKKDAVLAVRSCNFINAVDGRSNTMSLFSKPALNSDKDDFDASDTLDDMLKAYNKAISDKAISLQPSLSVTPTSANPGQRVLLQLEDYTANQKVDKVEVGGKSAGDPDETIGTGGSASFSITIPNGVAEGKQSLQIFIGGKGKDRVTMDIGGPEIQVNPATAVANQRVNLVGSGFTANSKVLKISVGNHDVYNKSDVTSTVDVNNGGGWSHSVTMPITAGTTTAGVQTIVVTDSESRSGSADINIPAREVTVTPASSRVGTRLTIQGTNFPSRNDDSQESTIVDIRYEPSAGSGTGTRVSVSPDSGGNFTASLTVPTSATPGSTNSVIVEFTYGDNNVPVTETKQHQVPSGEITLSKVSGPPGTALTVTGVGFRAYIPVNEVMVGGIDVTPSPKPQTDAQGNLSFDIVVPGVGTGIQTVEVKVGGGNAGTTASVGFTVTVSGIAAGDSVTVAEGAGPMGENFVRSFHFNNDIKAWTFYDPAAGESSTQTHFIAGETYWILVKETQDGVILNRASRSLTCVAGNCWNQIVW